MDLTKTRLIDLEEIEERVRNTLRIKKVWFAIRRRTIAIMDFASHIREIRCFIQRGRRGYADCDWWKMNSYLTSIILPMLKTMKANSKSYPGYAQASTSEKWEKLLDEMIEGFEAAQRIIADEYYKEVSGDTVEAVTKASREEVLKWGALCEADQKLFHQKVKIFTKWYFHLWD